ncbi:MAG: hypothetical protein ACAH11_14520 [Sphingomonas sp.]
MRGAALMAAAALFLFAGGEARAQIAPGFRAPASIVDGIDHAWGFACFLAAAGRPVAGLNIGMEQAGEGLHRPGRIPDDLAPLAKRLDGYSVVVLDAPGGGVWIFHSVREKRCVIVPYPLDTPGVAEAAPAMFAGFRNVKPVEGRPGVYAFDVPGAPRLEFHYQPAGDGLPQMIVTEQKKK